MSKFAKIYLTKDDEIVETINLLDQHLKIFSFECLNNKLAQETSQYLLEQYSTLENANITCLQNYKPNIEKIWERSTGWHCYILHKYAEKFPNYIWRVEMFTAEEFYESIVDGSFEEKLNVLKEQNLITSDGKFSDRIYIQGLDNSNLEEV